MKRFCYGFISALILLVLIGCNSLLNKNDGVLGKSSKHLSATVERIDSIDSASSKNSESRLNHIGAWAEGTLYMIDKVEPSKEQEVTKVAAERIKALANKPNFKEVQEIKSILDDLLLELKRGEQSLAKKDKEISKLTDEVKSLAVSKQTEIDKALKSASENAQKVDQYKSTLNEMDSMLGFGAIWYGLKKLVISSAWILGIGFVLFLVLRGFASSNPIAAAIFGIVNTVFSWFVLLIKGIAPKSVAVAGFTDNKTANGYRVTLLKMVDCIQTVKETRTETNLTTLTDELAKSFDSEDKQRVDEIKRELRWK